MSQQKQQQQQQQCLNQPCCKLTVKSATKDKTMKALTWQSKGNLKLLEVPVPAITDPHDAILRVTGTTICGSDLHLYHGEIPQTQSGDILGHEFMGIIDEIGPDVTKFKAGQRVVCSFCISCGNCEYCKKQLYTACQMTNPSSEMREKYGHATAGIFGYSHLLGGFNGGQAEYVRVPFADVNLLAIPDDVPDEKALFLSDIVCTSFHACREANPKKGESVGIWGLGPIGLLVAQWLKVFGVERIIGIDNVPERLAFAREKLGLECINFDEVKDIPSKIKELLNSDGLDKAIDCAAFRYSKSLSHRMQRAMNLETDTPEILNESILSVKKFGTIAVIADYIGTTNGFMIGALMEKGIRFIGCGQAPVQRYWEKCLDFIRRGEFDPTLILSHRFNLNDIVEAYKRFDAKDSSVMKVFIETQFSRAPAAGTPGLIKLESSTSLEQTAFKTQDLSA